MDDADLRRNQPTTHIAFDESTAILSATALLNRAFGVLSRLDQVTPDRRIEMVDLLSYAVGAILSGMHASQRAALKDFSYHLGLAFQLLDDVKDAVMSDTQAEKSVNRDIGKATILAVAGSKASRAKLSEYLSLAKAALQRAELANLETMTLILDHQFAFLRA